MTLSSAVHLRPYRLDDAAAVLEAARESLGELSPWMPWCHPEYSIDDSRSWLEIQVPAFHDGRAFEFAIVSADGKYLGGCGLNQIDKVNGRANLGYWVRSAARGHGVATAAVLLLRDWGFQNTDLARFEIVIAVGNAPSHRVAEKSGATREGTLRSRLVLNGARHDATMFSFVREGRRSSSVRRAAIGDEASLRRLRLEALSLEPYAFGSTYEREFARTVEDWQRWMSPGTVFILEDSRGARGMVAAAHDPADHAIVQLMAMWVQPDARGSGGADALVAAVVGWARSERSTAVRLEVVHDNLRARRFYERNGFKVIDGTRVRERDQAIELRMERVVSETL